MAIAVTTVSSGGLPVTDVTATHTKLGLHVAEVTKGLAITKGPGGLPVNFAPVADWPPSSGGGGGGGEATAFLARTTGLNATHTNAYIALIDGLVADGVWSKFDVLRIYATQDSATALLNLVSSNFNGTTHGSPTFTADRGFTGVDTSGTVYISNGFNPTTASSPKYVQNSAHISSWATNNAACQPPAGYADTSLSYSAYYFKYSDGNIYNRINGDGGSGNCGNIAYNGHIICQRTGSTAGDVFRNGASAYSGSLGASRSVINFNFYELGDNINNTPYGSGNQYLMVSWGSSLTSGQATAFYTRLRTYMTAVGVP